MISTIKCLECGSPIEIEDCGLGELIECDACGIDMKITETDPYKAKKVEE